jgi:hypothetical protein
VNIYLVTRTDTTGYDEQIEVVVIAEGENDAREFAARGHGDEGRDRWLIPSTTVTLLGTAEDGLDAGTYCRDFHAG